MGSAMAGNQWRNRQIYDLIGQMNPPIKTFHIGILVFPSCLQSCAVAPMDVFNIANAVVQYRPAAEHVRFETHWIGARGDSVTTSAGLRFPTVPIDQRYDALIVPGVDHDNPTQLTLLLDQLGPEQELLHQFALSGRLLASNCSSTFLVARTGLLDGRRATTSWWLNTKFRKSFPKVELDTEALIVQDGPFLSSGGVTAFIDMSLWLVGHFASEELRQITAKVLVADSQRASQSPYIAAGIAQGNSHAVIERARRWLNAHMDQEWSMAQLSEHCHTSARTLLRRFQKAVGLSPIQYTQQLRVERAKALLESSMLSLEDITGRCGYENVSTFSKVFKRWTNVTPREYRSRFGMRS
jgi:transcriptional regulator GlxA family with amidase domain